MENESRIVELLAESLIKQDEMIDELKGSNQKLDNVEAELVNVKKEIFKLNIQTVENSRAIFKLATEVENIAKLHERVTNLEKAVYK